ncbi:general alpha-glucoside permease [Diaporthe helianthi]|uniref:General alpha-glucoside permease n=1 Tax=Diaporthe helianthi TaxID=158607 RepID=A0A2P5HL29_DIAHE|nr:general alpha-glucoside permease [Diaporthe helianthi]
MMSKEISSIASHGSPTPPPGSRRSRASPSLDKVRVFTKSEARAANIAEHEQTFLHAFFWAATAALTTVWAYFRLPEVKDRTYEELDVLFARKLSARQFKSAEVHVYEDSEYQIFLE